jgi:hypothetical protein
MNGWPVILLDGREVAGHFVREHKLLELWQESTEKQRRNSHMNAKLVAVFALAAGLIAGSLFIAHAQGEAKPAVLDPRVDKLIEQNEKILKNQDEILRQLAEVKEGVLQIRRRSS